MIKTCVAVIVAWLLCGVLLGQPLPVFAAIATLLVVQPSVNQTLTRGIERSLGVIFGVLLAYGASRLFGHSSWTVLGIIVVALLLAWALKLTVGSANQIPISAMLVLVVGIQTPGYAFNRVVETIIGAIVGLIVNAVIVPPVLLTPAHTALRRLAESVAGTLNILADALRSTDQPDLTTILVDARKMRAMRDSAEGALVKAEESLMLNPRRKRYESQLALDRELFAALSILVTRVVGMARSLRDRYEPDLRDDPIVPAIATELDRAAHDLLLRVSDLRRSAEEPGVPGPITAEMPALTAPLVVPRPNAEHWILVGSLLEDLRRVREEIIGGE
ncbi:MAG TPA: FUSC family protein [Lacisediminihabitans sp.]|uniref:FUSC family protein n=1 Tax=Lacisediminihabitans sp. TaxID=2787631 RepID=UPI002ED899BE